MYEGINIGPVSDLARSLLNMKRFKLTQDMALRGLPAVGVNTAATKAISGSSGGGSETAKVDEAYWEKKRAGDQAQRDASVAASDKEWSGIMGDAAKKNKAFNDAGAKEWSDNEALKGGDSLIGSAKISPLGADGQQVSTDQNGGSMSTRSGGSEDEQAKKDEEDGFTQTSDSSSGSSIEYMAKGGPVKAGKKYIVGEGGKDEVYVQGDGDVYPLTDQQGIIPKEDGTIISNPKLRKLARVMLNNKG